MGLTVHYELHLPGSTSEAEALERLEQLQRFAASLGTPFVTPVIRVSQRDLSEEQDSNSLERMLSIMASIMHRDVVATGFDALDHSALGLAAFAINVGKECEPMIIGLATPIPEPPIDVEGSDLRLEDWHWYGFCKTQYASAVSHEHFLTCHHAVVAVLDEAVRLGFDATVFDEGGYWEERSDEKLLAQVERSNHLLAHFAGALHDAIGEVQNVSAPIFSHPDFERLETAPIPPVDGS